MLLLLFIQLIYQIQRMCSVDRPQVITQMQPLTESVTMYS
jgi:hypothetical protein